MSSHGSRDTIEPQVLLHDLRAAIKGAKAGTFYYNFAKDKITWDDRSLEIFGYTREEFERNYTAWTDRLHLDDRAATETLFAQQVREKSPVNLHYKIVLPDGEIRHIWAVGSLLFDENGNTRAVTGLHLDQTEQFTSREQLEHEVSNYQRLSQAVFEQAPIGIVFGTPEGQVFFSNQAFSKIVGYSPEELQGMNLSDFTHENNLEYEWELVREIQRGLREQYQLEKQYVHKNGGHLWVDVTISAFRDEDGEIQFYMGLITDISERREMEALRRAKLAAEQANSTKTQFVANMSHELRTPLNSILGFSRLLLRSDNFSPEQQEQMQLIHGAGQHLLQLINELLDFSRFENRKVTLLEEDFHLPSLLKETLLLVEDLATEKGLTLRSEWTSQLEQHVVGDTARIRQILLNLLTNAVRYTPQGEITLRAQTERASDEAVLLTLEVEDTGVGIPKAMIGRIFDPFVQAQDIVEAHRGTGLGLSITREIVELFGGTIQVQSQQGKGSLFQITLPLMLSLAQEHKPESIVSQLPAYTLENAPPCRFLIVDDYLDGRLLLRSLLEQNGFTPDCVSSGQEALQMFGQQPYDFVWMDLQMPEMNGYETTQRIRELPGGKDAFICAITADLFSHQEKVLLNSGFDAFLRKPFHEEDFFAIIQKGLPESSVAVQHADSGGFTAIATNPSEFQEGKEVWQLQLRLCSEEWVNGLKEAALLCDVKHTFSLLEQLPEELEELQEGLEKMVFSFRFDQLNELLEEL